MKKSLYIPLTLLSIFLLACVNMLNAQPPGGELPAERLKGLRIAFFSEKLDLTPTEAEKFWPVYNAYAAEVDKVRGERKELFRKLRRSTDGKSDSELEAAADRHIELLQKEVEIQKRHHDKFTRRTHYDCVSWRVDSSVTSGYSGNR